MKNTTFLMVLTIVLLAFSSCEEETPPAPPVTYSINITKTGEGTVVADKVTGIFQGNSVNIKFIPEKDYSLYSVKINGVLVEEIKSSATEVTFTLTNINKNNVVEVAFVETNVLIISVKSTNEKPWMWTKLDVYKKEDWTYLYSVYLTHKEKTHKHYYLYPSMQAVRITEDGDSYSAIWSLKKSLLIVSEHDYPILELTSNILVFKQGDDSWSSVHNCITSAVFTYERK